MYDSVGGMVGTDAQIASIGREIGLDSPLGTS